MNHGFPSWIDKNSLITPPDMGYIEAKLEGIINSLGEKHLSWWEHKGSNQCRICDLIVLLTRMIDLYYTKSSLDYMNAIDDDFKVVCARESEPEPSGMFPVEN